MNGLQDMNVPYGRKLTWSFVLSSTYRLWGERFWTFFRIGLPIALLTYLFTPFQRAVFRELFAMLSQHGLVRYSTEFWVLLNAFNLFTKAVYWLISAIFFAAIAANLIGSGDEELGVISDAYSKVRNRLGSLVTIGLATGTLFFIAVGTSNFIILMALYKLRLQPGFIASVAIFSVPLLIVAGLLSRLALAIPELMDNAGISVRDAIRASIRKTENWEPFFMFFIAKSALVGYAVYWLAERGFEQLWNRTPISESLYDWITWLVYVCLFALLESPLFIAFSILYRESKLKPEAALTAEAIR